MTSREYRYHSYPRWLKKLEKANRLSFLEGIVSHVLYSKPFNFGNGIIDSNAWEDYALVMERMNIQKELNENLLSEHAEQWRKEHPTWLQEYEKGNFDNIPSIYDNDK